MVILLDGQAIQVWRGGVDQDPLIPLLWMARLEYVNISLYGISEGLLDTLQKTRGTQVPYHSSYP